MTAGVDVNGIRLAYRADGDPSHPPLVLLHGLGDSSHDWQPVLPALAVRFRTYALDLRGHGASTDPAAHSFELMRDDVLAFLDAFGITSCTLIGHSMGAVVATLVTAAAGHRVSHLVLEDATAPRPSDLHRPPMTDPDIPAVVHAIRAQLTDPDPAWFAGYATITVPTLIVGGADSSIPHTMLTAAAQRLPHAELVTVAAGHHVHRDNPAAFLAAVTAFLDRSHVAAPVQEHGGG